MVSGVPRSWDARDLLDFLQGQKWTQVEVCAKKGQGWYFKGFAPPGEPASSAWNYQLEDDPDWVISVALTTGKKQDTVVSKLKKPKQKHEDVQAEMLPDQEVAPTAMDDIQSDFEDPPRPPSPLNAEAEPKKPRIRAPVDPTEARKQQWVMRDLGGTGDCFFRAVAECLAWQEDDPKPLTEASAIAKGANLRSRSVQHARKHQGRFSELFSCKQDFDSWI